MKITNWFRLPFRSRSCKGRTPARRRPEARRVRPQVEGLEQRQVPTVTNSLGGSILPNVEAVPIFYGSNWHTQAPSDVGYLTSFVQDLVNSPYMDMLTNAGYGVGRGSSASTTFTSDGQSEPDTLDQTQILTDANIQSTLQWWISNDGKFAGLQPDANRLYVIFVEPGVEVSDPIPTGNPPVTTTWTSGQEANVNHFLAYHEAFVGQDNNGHQFNIRYVVVPYDDGGVNGTLPWLSVRDTMTEATSHEVAEAVTDPDGSAYQDPSLVAQGKPAEIGDIVNQSVVYQHGFAVQREADMNDLPMTPSDATAQRQVTFLVETTVSYRPGWRTPWGGGSPGTWTSTNELFERTPDGTRSPVLYGIRPTTDIRSISDQGIDNYGKAMIDVVFNDGTAWEYHDGGQWVFLANNVQNAKAGQAVSYVLDTNGNVTEFVEGLPNNNGMPVIASQNPIASNVGAIDAGTDFYGDNMVVVTQTATTLGLPPSTYEISDTGYWHFIGNNLAQASAGRGGNVDYIDSTGEAWYWNEASQVAQDLGSGATKVTAGYTSDDGSYVLDVLFSDGTVWDWRNGRANAQRLGTDCSDLSKARGGIVDVIDPNGTAWESPWVGDWFVLYGANGNVILGGVTTVTEVA